MSEYDHLRGITTPQLLAATVLTLCDAIDEAEVSALDMGDHYRLTRRDWETLLDARNVIAAALIPEEARKP